MEHFLPAKKHPKRASDYTNLFWSCPDCNAAKLDKEVGILNPDQGLAQHLAVHGERVVHLTDAGETMISELRLNRGVYVRRRQKRAEYLADLAEIERILHGNPSLPDEDIRTLKRLLEVTRRALHGPPHDVPTECRCPH